MGSRGPEGKPSRKGTGFEQPPHPHQHWHIDIFYINREWHLTQVRTSRGYPRSNGKLEALAQIAQKPNASDPAHR
jgi:hypothetical protein